MKFLGGKGKPPALAQQGKALDKSAPRPKLDGVKASLVMPCSTNPPQATEYLLLIVNGTQFVGGKRAAKLAKGGSGDPSSSVPIYSGLSYKNGLDSSCVICGNATFGGCPACHTFSCLTEGKPQTCTKCGLHLAAPYFGKNTSPLSGSKPAPGRVKADQVQALTASRRRLITDR